MSGAAKRAKGVGAAIVWACAILFIAVHGSQAQNLTGAGSTFVAPVLTKWVNHYVALGHPNIQYQAVGSGAGILAAETGGVDFGATDKPLSSWELAKYGLCQFPIVIGGIVPVVNLPGISVGQIKLSGRILANIFMGRTTQWNDPDIAGANPKLALPDLPITVVYRSDASGTTYNFSDFLAKSNSEWRARFGTTLMLDVPTGAARQGNAGVASAVRETLGSIGYVEYTYALQNYLTYGAVVNAFGIFVPPSSDSFRAAASAVSWQRHPDFDVLMTSAPDPHAYPIAATTFILLPKAPKNAARTIQAMAFFKWALENGQVDALELNYAPLPSDVVAQIEGYWAANLKTVLPKAPPARKQN